MRGYDKESTAVGGFSGYKENGSGFKLTKKESPKDLEDGAIFLIFSTKVGVNFRATAILLVGIISIYY